MRQQLKQSLKDLEAEYAAGQKTLVELKNRQDALRGTLLRISGELRLSKKSYRRTAKKKSKPNINGL